MNVSVTGVDQPSSIRSRPVEFRGVTKTYPTRPDPTRALGEISVEIRRNEFISIIGPSGCGKSTLLKMVAGLSYPSTGVVLCNGTPVCELNRSVGFVTQDSNLFPWLTMYENVEFGLAARNVARKERQARVQELIGLVGLAGFERRYPFELSGGMQKRASLIRTMVYEPQILLMDEPYGAVDAQVRLFLQNELLSMWSRRPVTVLFVTHDLVEAIALSDRIVVMSARPGRIKALIDVPIARPRNVFEIHKAPDFDRTYSQVWELMKGEVRFSDTR